MLSDITVDYRQTVKELDYTTNANIAQIPVDIVQILYKIKKTGLYDKKKLQKLLSHYAIEHDNILVLKP